MKSQTTKPRIDRSKMNPWLTIPLQDYEGHMALPAVRQDRLLSDLLHGALKQYLPDSVCILGCSGGNGFDRIPRDCRLCGIDINPAYIETARLRYEHLFTDARFLTCDIEAGIPDAIGGFDLVYAALLFEYIDVESALRHILPVVNEYGRIVVVAQLPTEGMEKISETPFTSLYALDGFMRLVDIDGFSSLLRKHGFAETVRSEVVSAPGKRFCVLHFRRVSESV